MISLDYDSLSGEIAPALSQSSSGGDQQLVNSSVPIQRSQGTTSSKADSGSWATHRSTPTRSHPGDLVGKYGVQASATDLEALPFGPNPPPGYPSLGTLLQNRSPRSGSKRPVDRPSSSNRSARSLRKGQFSSHRSTDRCTLNILPVTGSTGHTVRPNAPGRLGTPVTPVNTGQKAQEVQDTQLLDRSELLVLNSPVRPVQLEHNVHESFDLLNSDSPDDRADESPEWSILRHSGHRAPVTPAPVIPVTLALVIPVTPAPVTPVRLFFVLILVKRPGKQFFSHVEMEPPIPGYYQYFWGVNVSCSRKQHTDRPRIEPGSPDPESDALTTRPVRSPVRL